MGLFSRFRNRPKKPPLMERLVIAAVGTAVGTVMDKLPDSAIETMAPESKKMDSVSLYEQQKKEEDAKRALERRKAHTNLLVGEMALYYYLASVDGSVTSDERAELDRLSNAILADGEVTEEGKMRVREIKSKSTNMTFFEITTYLDKVDAASLISFAVEMEKLAEADGNVAPREEDAIALFKDYVTSKTGHRFAKKIEEPKETKELELVCPKCAGQMSFNETMLQVTCQFCGYAKMVDINQLSDVLSTIERTKRIQLLLNEDKK